MNITNKFSIFNGNLKWDINLTVQLEVARPHNSNKTNCGAGHHAHTECV